MDINEPRFPRQRKQPRRYDDGLSSGDFHGSPKTHFRQHFYEAIDLIVSCIEERFDQPGYKIYHQLEDLLVKACKQADNLQSIMKFYKDDFNQDLLHAQLETFSVHYQSTQNPQQEQITIFDIKRYFLSMSPAQLSLCLK